MLEYIRRCYADVVKRPVLVGGDLSALLVFVSVGRKSHGEDVLTLVREQMDCTTHKLAWWLYSFDRLSNEEG